MAIKNRMNDHNPAKPPVTSNIPQVSIGMPVYNGAKFIREALDSLLAQTFTDFELIISDNASTDETEKICREYAAKDDRIRYVKQVANLGAVANFQFVLYEALGEYFMWAAADDIWADNWIKELEAAITQDCLAVRGGIIFFDNSGECKLSPTSFFKGQFVKCFLEDDTLARCHHIYGLFYRKKLLKADFNNLKSKYAGDVIFICYLLRFGDLITVNTTEHRYRHHDLNLGAIQASQMNSWKRYAYRVYPWEYYMSHVKAVPYSKKIYIISAIPIKYIKSQIEMWYRGYYKIILKRKYHEKSRNL
jgi:glycosyltransferase involved in cell wall biosynthesis